MLVIIARPAIITIAIPAATVMTLAVQMIRSTPMNSVMGIRLAIRRSGIQ